MKKYLVKKELEAYKEKGSLVFENKVLDVHACAELLGVSNKTIYRLVANGELPHRRISERTIRFSASEILKWIEKEE